MNAAHEPGRDSRVDDWFGQSVDDDAELVDELLDDTDDLQEAERRFEEESTGKAEQAARRGEVIDPDQGRSAYDEGRT